MKKPSENIPENESKPFHNVLFSGNDRGGVGKTFNNTQLGDALEALGYSVNFVDADPGSSSMIGIVPSARVVDPSKEEELDQLFSDIAEGDADLTIVDLGAGTTGSNLAKYFANGGDIRERLGIRVIIGISINSDPEAIKCSIPWIEGLSEVGEFMTLVSHEKTIPFDFNKLPAGEILLDISENRVIHFARLPDRLLEHYTARKGKAAEFIEGGALVDYLGLNIFESAAWNVYRNDTINGVYPYAEFLTGRKAPNPPKEYPRKVKDASKEKENKAKLMREKIAEARRNPLPGRGKR
ncbi:MAG: hypothetical protein EBR40_00115 [Proteobacteria bacterium]|nr:hypothetical protein [Pseudomonadota bacterium]